ASTTSANSSSSKAASSRAHKPLITARGSAQGTRETGRTGMARDSATPTALFDSVDDDGAVDPIGKPLVRAKERAGVVVARDQEPVIAAQPPSAVRCEPLHSAAEVAGEVSFSALHAERLAAVNREAAEAGRRVRHELRASSPERTSRRRPRVTRRR